MTATKTITLAFDLAARTEGELPDSDDVRGSLENKAGHGLPPSWWSQDRGYWITAIEVPAERPDNTKCPACGDQIKGREIGYPRPLRRLKPHACPNCDASWYEVYEFARVEMITTPEPAPPLSPAAAEAQKRQTLQDLGIIGSPSPTSPPGDRAEDSAGA